MGEGTKFTGVQYGNDLAPGGGWTWTWAGTGISASYDYRVAGREKVIVPAGTFDAVRVDYEAKVLSETRGELGPIRGTLWIVEGVGLVKQYEDDPGATSLLPETTILELLEVTSVRVRPGAPSGVSFNGSGRSSPERVIGVRILVRPPVFRRFRRPA
jgi:hypothetical protein